MKKSIAELRGMTPAMRRALRSLGITDSNQLLAAAGTKDERRRLARACGCDHETILALVHRADMTRLKGVGGLYADLLEKCGAGTLAALRRRDPRELHQALMEANERFRYARQVPTVGMVARWIDQARELPTGIDE